ncbi:MULTISPECIES: helix-turn-helix domain-containing protein [Clostridia]|uniref:DNA-binding Xre family transcriptional regulator n=1 Tax=Aminicella lysinilytica TaxID=433323 RepID=A0A4R6Q3J1_9FIRM|nr:MULTISPECIES: helix-turn-helix transcriptional regulator [Clostridia]MDT4376955.1 helix-turn-helix transcriptional regulator [Blautia coccoides]TDP56410.1 DNA-binding Xre family transcriptional regulator [Aminicella lysinilytica]
MKLSYLKLQKLMVENQMKGTDLIRAAEITAYAMTKINKNEPVSLENLMRICKVFHCDIGDICEVILED